MTIVERIAPDGSPSDIAMYVASESAASSTIVLPTRIAVRKRVLSSTSLREVARAADAPLGDRSRAQARDGDERRLRGRKEARQEHEHDERGDLVRQALGLLGAGSVFKSAPL